MLLIRESVAGQKICAFNAAAAGCKEGGKWPEREDEERDFSPIYIANDLSPWL